MTHEEKVDIVQLQLPDKSPDLSAAKHSLTFFKLAIRLFLGLNDSASLELEASAVCLTLPHLVVIRNELLASPDCLIASPVACSLS